MNSFGGIPASQASLTAYRAQYQVIESDRADVQQQLADVLALPWYKRLFERARINELKAREADLKQKSDSIHRLMKKLIKTYNPNAFQ